VHDIDPAKRSSAAHPLSWQQARQAAWSANLAGPPTDLVVRAVVITCVAFAVAGAFAGWLWAQLADPAAYEVLRAGAIMGEEQAGREFGVDVTYALIAVCIAVPLGLLAGWRWHRVGWPEVLAAAGGSGIAAVLSWRLGIVWGPDDPVGRLPTAQVGDLLPAQLDVHAKGLLLAWPVGALVGVIIAVLLFSRPSRPQPYGANDAGDAW
jgi:hypothetical protein